MADNSIGIDMNVDLKKFKDDLDNSVLLARDTGKVLDKQLKLEMQLNIDDIEQKIKKAKEQLKTYGEDSEEAKKLRLEIGDYKRNLTEAKRELNNYLNNGDKNLSRLQAKFDGVTDEIEKSRKTLLELGKSTKVLDKFEKQVEELTKDLHSGKINVDEYRKSLDKINAKLTNANGIFTQLKKSVTAFGVALVAGLSARTIANFAKDAVLEFAKFEKGLARINTVANVSDKQMQKLGITIKNLSAKYGIAKDELLETGFNISSAGVEFQNIGRIMELSAITAIGAGTDTTTAFNGIIAVIKKYGENLNIAGSVAEKFFIANKLGQTTIEAMAQAMQNLSSKVVPAGVQINEVFAILATATGVTGNANQVITQLNGAIDALSSPTKEARKQFDALGIEVGQTAIKQKGFVNVAKDVYDAVGQNTEALRKLIPEKEAASLIIALATTQNKKYNDSLNELSTDGVANLEEAVSKMANTTEFKLKIADSKWENFKVGVGNKLVTIWGYIYDTGSVIKSIFLGVFGYVLGSAGIALGGFVAVVHGGLKDVAYNFKELGRVIPEYIKAGLNNLPGIMSAGLRAMLGVIPGGMGDVLADKLGLDNFGNVFGEVNTNFSFRNTGVAIGSFQKQRSALTQSTQAEFDNVANILQGRGKVYQNEVGKLTDSIRNEIDQSFGDETINKLNTRLDELNAELRDTEIGTDRFKELKKEIGEVEEQLFGATKTQDNLTKATTGGAKKSSKAKEEEIDVEKELEEAQKERNKLVDEYNDKIEKGRNIIQKFYDEVSDGGKKAQDNIQKLQEDIDELTKKIAEETGNKDIAIAERKIELEKERLETLEKIAEATQEADKFSKLQGKLEKVDEKLAGEVSDSKRKTLEEERLKILEKISDKLENERKLTSEQSELRKKLIDQEKEMELINSNIDETALSDVYKKQGQYETNNILDEFNKSVISDNGESLQEQLEEKETAIAKEQEMYEKIIEMKRHLEEGFTAFLKEQNDERLSLYEELQAKSLTSFDELKGIGFDKKGVDHLNQPITNNLEIKLEGLSVRSEQDIQSIADKVYQQIEQETRIGSKNYY